MVPRGVGMKPQLMTGVSQEIRQLMNNGKAFREVKLLIRFD